MASPEAAASILWRDSARAIDAATSMKITAQDLKTLGVIDVIITEPVGGAHRDRSDHASDGRCHGQGAVEFAGMSPAEILQQRHEKFLEIGRSLNTDFTGINTRQPQFRSNSAETGQHLPPRRLPRVVGFP